MVYSLLATCKAHGVDERAWLEDVLRRMPEYELGKKDFSDLLRMLTTEVGHAGLRSGISRKDEKKPYW